MFLSVKSSVLLPFLPHLNPTSLWLWQPPSPSHASTVRLGFIACGGGGVVVPEWVRYFNTWTSWCWIYADEVSSCPPANLLPPLPPERALLPPVPDYDLRCGSQSLWSPPARSLPLLRGLLGHNYLMKSDLRAFSLISLWYSAEMLYKKTSEIVKLCFNMKGCRRFNCFFYYYFNLFTNLQLVPNTHAFATAVIVKISSTQMLKWLQVTGTTWSPFFHTPFFQLMIWD